MKRHFFLLTLALMPTWTPVLAADLSLSPLEVIHKNGQLRATDGKSFYTLKGNDSFSSGPLGDSGIAIRGKWKLESSAKGLTVQVEGLWWMVNQSSRRDDFRTMRLVIRPGVLLDTGHPETDTYKCSFAIEDMKSEPHVPPPNTTPIPPVKMDAGGSDSTSH